MPTHVWKQVDTLRTYFQALDADEDEEEIDEELMGESGGAKSAAAAGGGASGGGGGSGMTGRQLWELQVRKKQEKNNCDC